ncbi:hypothetical protein BV22DRAFT_1035896 [Leucogyrophana mollusca]|uniref:Uncharacterized protein n=1 Tax=Leucogyrophana mollusca TaxID=85980 RepID=A0ACB8BGA4_9AGAM|nr:hypothetical protein BV22DRAFT_1035896 [Leucogyrophana mollusca]
MTIPDGLLKSTFEAIFDQVRHASGLRKTNLAKLRLFATDVALVAHSVRCSYLVDAISVNDPGPFFSRLLQALRKKNTIFVDLVHWHDPSSLQSFIVNTPLLETLCADLLSTAGRHWTTCVRLDDPPIGVRPTSE